MDDGTHATSMQVRTYWSAEAHPKLMDASKQTAQLNLLYQQNLRALLIQQLLCEVQHCRCCCCLTAVYWILGARHSAILSVAQHANMILTTIGYQIAAADSMR